MSARPGRRPARLLGEAAIGIALLGGTAACLDAWVRIGLVEQDRACLPGIDAVLYLLAPGLPARGALYAFRPPDLVHRLGLFPDDIVFVKRVAALPGDRVIVDADGVRVNGIPVAAGLDLAARLGQAPARFHRRYTVPEGHLLLLGETRTSLDGRYFGAVEVAALGLGRAWALW